MSRKVKTAEQEQPINQENGEPTMEDLVRAIREARALSEVRRREQAKAVEKICEAERQLSHLERTLVESVPEAKQLLDALRANAQEVLS